MTDAPIVNVTREGDSVTIASGGLLDLTNSQGLERELKQATETSERVVVDFRDAVFIDTAVVQCLASAAVALRKRKARLCVRVKKGSHPEHVITVLGFRELMDVED